jgi:hypothetical protein
MALKVQDQSPEVLAMAANWPIAQALLGGTAAMRKAGAQFLPKQPAEAQEDWDYRIKVSTLFPAFTRTISVMTGKPFAKQITLGEDVPANIQTWCQDADQQGNSLHSVCTDVMSEAMGYGICGVLVDYPKVGAAAPTKAAEAKLGVRPYLVFIRHAQILGWKAERIAGATRLTQLRIAETAEVPDGAFGVIEKKRVRVLSPGAFEVWQKIDDKEEYELLPDESGTTTIDVIPFVPFYGKKLGYMCGVSPLLDLAFLNVEHWQESSDQKDSVRFARKRLLVLTGATDVEGEIAVGSNMAMKLPQGSDAKIVQGSAESVVVGRSELAALEEQMIQTGAELLVNKPGEQKSATQSNNDAEANKSDLQRIVETFEDSLDQVLQLMAKWVREPQGGHASLFKDFGAATLSDASAQLILNLRAAGLISGETALREQQRRGTLAADLDPAKELQTAKDDPPPGPTPAATGAAA